MALAHFRALYMLCQVLMEQGSAKSKEELVKLVLRGLKEIPWPVDYSPSSDLTCRFECLSHISNMGYSKVAMDFWREYGPQIESSTNDTALLWEARSHWLMACLEASSLVPYPQEDRDRAFAEAKDLAPRVFQMVEDLRDSGATGRRRRTSVGGGANESVCDMMRQ